MATATATALRAVDISKNFGKVEAVRKVDMVVEHGKVLALLGPNGAGKTTLMKMFLGLVKPSHGTAEISGISVSDPESRKGVRYLPEDIQFQSWAIPLFTFKQIGRLSDPVDVREFLEKCEQLECSDMIERPFGKMSRGQKQRILIALVTSGRPDFLFLDEPSNGLDPVGRVALRLILRKAAETGTTILINSHLLGEVERTCDTAAFIDEGELIASGDLNKLARAIGKAEIESISPEKMLNALQKNNFTCEIDREKILVDLDRAHNFRDLTEKVLETDVPFTGLRVVMEDLEDIFIRLTGRERKAK